MHFQRLQHFIMAIMLGCALVLSVISSVIAYHIIQQQALSESSELTQNLIAAIRPTAGAAVFAGTEGEALAKDAIDGLLQNEAIYSVQLVGFADDANKGFTLSGINKLGGTGLKPIKVPLQSLFGNEVLGELTVQPRMEWMKEMAMDAAVSMILTLIIVIFATSFFTAQLIRMFLSKPLVNVVAELKQVTPGGDQRLGLAEHLKPNEIGWLVSEFNTMLDKMKEAILTERGLRRDMELVQQSLEKAKQVAEQATEAKSNFLATMSHEIRTPMNSVLGFLELALESTEVGSQTRRHLQVAQSSARFLLQLINDILDVSKIESGKLELDIHPFDLAAMLQETHDLMEIKAQEKQLPLNLTIPEKLAPSYNSDPYRLRQVLINLVGNAIKFTDTGSVDIHVKDMGGNRFEFSIVDTGIGIAEDKIDAILKPFTQVDASISRHYGGTGLGTTISSELVQLLGGELKIQSILGKGSRFYFTIELEPLDIVTKTVSKQSAKVMPARALNLLLVDDVAENISLAKIHLERAGHKVETAENGLQACEAAKREHFDLVLMDIQMPEMDGYEATGAIRQQNEHNAKMPIVAMTANAMKQEHDKVMEAGMDDIVVKPIDFTLLFDVLGRLTYDGAELPTRSGETQAEQNGEVKLVDVQAGLVSWIDEDAYYKALGNFAGRNEQTLEELAVVINTKDVAKADALVHKVKGAAGNLRLVALFEASCALEAKLHEADVQLEINMFKPFTAVLRDTLAAVVELISNRTPEQSQAVESMNKPACAGAINAFLEACDQHDPDAAEAAMAEMARFIPSDALADVDQQLQQFDFYGAMDKVNLLAEKFAIEINTQ